MAPGRAANIVSQLLRALGAAHRAGIVHRDMKPDNIRVGVDEDGIERPKILDFGVVKIISGDMGEMTGGLKTKTGIVLGTPKYMAPEQCRGASRVDARADVYSVGACSTDAHRQAPFRPTAYSASWRCT
jgi:serine/threonine-protein kinase